MIASSPRRAAASSSSSESSSSEKKRSERVLLEEKETTKSSNKNKNKDDNTNATTLTTTTSTSREVLLAECAADAKSASSFSTCADSCEANVVLLENELPTAAKRLEFKNEDIDNRPGVYHRVGNSTT